MIDQRTARFRELHNNGSILRLANAWDVASAKLFESLGASAIATTSAGVAWAFGYADGYKLPVGYAVGLAAKLASMVSVPLTVDIENGYSDKPSTVAEVVLQLADVGVAGVNIEDGRQPVDLLERKIAATKDALHKRDLDVFINARTDVYLSEVVGEPDMLNETLVRAKRYAAAGADGIFVPAMTQREHIQKIVADIALPINVLAWNGLPDAATLERLGVRRLSAGSAIAQVTWGQAQRAAKEFLEIGQLERFTEEIPYSHMQRLFA